MIDPMVGGILDGFFTFMGIAICGVLTGFLLILIFGRY